jgi:hypothetical protein
VICRRLDDLPAMPRSTRLAGRPGPVNLEGGAVTFCLWLRRFRSLEGQDLLFRVAAASAWKTPGMGAAGAWLRSPRCSGLGGGREESVTRCYRRLAGEGERFDEPATSHIPREEVKGYPYRFGPGRNCGCPSSRKNQGEGGRLVLHVAPCAQGGSSVYSVSRSGSVSAGNARIYRLLGHGYNPS